MAIGDQRHAYISKQTTLLDGVDIDPPEWCVCGDDLNRSVHEGMNNISNVKVYLRTRSGNVNIGFRKEKTQNMTAWILIAYGKNGFSHDGSHFMLTQNSIKHSCVQ